MKDSKKMTIEELTEELTEENWQKAKKIFGSMQVLEERFNESIRELEECNCEETAQEHPRINKYVELVEEQKEWD